MIVFELDIPSLTEEWIQLRDRLGTPFMSVIELKSESAKWRKESQVDADSLDRFIRHNGIVMSVFDIHSLKGIERLVIGYKCYANEKRFVIDGLNELKTIIIGYKSFELDENTGEGSKCVIMNCDQLSEIHIGGDSFYWYESFELKNLPSLISIQLDNYAFCSCHLIVFESMND